MYGKTEFHIYTDTHSFVCDYNFYSNTAISDKVTYKVTPIFRLSTNVAGVGGDTAVYKCVVWDIYIVVFIMAFVTFLISIIIISKTWGWERNINNIKFDYLVNIALINAFICIITVLIILLRAPY
jgi:hypothetical protein